MSIEDSEVNGQGEQETKHNTHQETDQAEHDLES